MNRDSGAFFPQGENPRQPLEGRKFFVEGSKKTLPIFLSPREGMSKAFSPRSPQEGHVHFPFPPSFFPSSSPLWNVVPFTSAQSKDFLRPRLFFPVGSFLKRTRSFSFAETTKRAFTSGSVLLFYFSLVIRVHRLPLLSPRIVYIIGFLRETSLGLLNFFFLVFFPFLPARCRSLPLPPAWPRLSAILGRPKGLFFLPTTIPSFEWRRLPYGSMYETQFCQRPTSFLRPPLFFRPACGCTRPLRDD